MIYSELLVYVVFNEDERNYDRVRDLRYLRIYFN